MRKDAKGGNGEDCYNAEAVVGYDAEAVVGYDVTSTASYDVDQEQQGIEETRSNITALKDAQAALTADGLPTLPGASTVLCLALLVVRCLAHGPDEAFLGTAHRSRMTVLRWRPAPEAGTKLARLRLLRTHLNGATVGHLDLVELLTLGNVGDSDVEDAGVVVRRLAVAEMAGGDDVALGAVHGDGGAVVGQTGPLQRSGHGAPVGYLDRPRLAELEAGGRERFRRASRRSGWGRGGRPCR